MNIKTTLTLIVLAGAGVLLWWYGDLHLPPALELTPRPVVVEEKGTREFLDSLSPEKIQRIEVRAPRGITELTRRADGQWGLPGNWPIRRHEVDTLVGLLTSLRSRFQAEPIHGDKELHVYGMDQPAVTVTIRTGGEEHTLAFGEQQTNSMDNRFSRDTYVRLDQRREVVRLAPGLVVALDKPTDYYQERRLFEKESISGEDRRDSVEQLQARSLTVEDKKDGGRPFTIVRTAKNWKEAELAEPVRDRLDEEARKSLLVGVLDLWAEQFVPSGSGGVSPWLWHAHAYWDTASVATDFFFATQGGLLVRAGLTDPERIITTKSDKGDTVTLFIGSVSSRRQRLVPAPQQPGMPPGMQQQRMMPVTEEYRYAKLQYNDQVFEIKADKLKDVFVALDKLRDSRIARFSSSDARRVEIQHGGEDIELQKDGDNWKLVKPLSAEADNSKVSDLLNKLSDLQARDKDVIDKDDPKKYGFDKPEAVVKLTLEEEVKESERREASPAAAEKKTRTLTVRVGKHDKDKKKLYVMADNWPRINAVDDSLAALVERSALAYRGKRLFDFTATDVAKIDIDNQGKKVTIERSRVERGSEGSGWRLARPVTAEADAAKVNQLLGDLGRLEAAEFVSQEPKPAEMETQYGLGKPRLTVRIEFTDKNKPAKEVRIGKPRGDKGGYFACVSDRGPVFAVNDDLHKQLTRDSLSYRPQTLWQLIPEEIEWVRVQKAGQKEYRLSRSDNVWKIGGPFDARAVGDTVQKMTAELVAPKVESYLTHEAKNLAEYGLDKPALTVSLKPVLSKDEKDHSLLIGKATKEGGTHYAKRSNDSAIFTLGNSFFRAVDHTALDLLDTKLLSLDAAKVERVRTQAGDKSLTLERSLAQSGNEKSEWRVTESPAGSYPADAGAMASSSRIWSDLRAQRFADYGGNVNWSKFGLEKPAIRISVTADKSEHAIELGKEVEGEPGSRYARVDKGAGVAVLPLEQAIVLERTYLDYVNHDLLKFDSAVAVSLQRRLGTKILEIDRQAGAPGKVEAGWQVAKPTKEKADEQTMQELLEQLGNLRAERIAAFPRSASDSVKEDDKFGLASPSALVTIKLMGDRKPVEHIIKLGKTAGKGGGRFAMVDDGKAVAVLPGSLVEQLTGDPLAFRDRAIVRFNDADRLQLDRGPRHAVFSKTDGSWKLTEPLQSEVEQDSLDDFLGRLTRLRAAALVVEKPDEDALKKYGLDRPEVQWRVQSGAKDVLRLLIGNKEAKGERRYAKLAKGEVVFLLDAGLTHKALDEYRPRTVWTPSLDAVDIESLNYRSNRAPFLLEKTGSNWQAIGKPDAKINAATVEDTLAALAGLKLSRYAVDKDANLALFGLDKPDLILEIATRSGKRMLHIGNIEGNSKGRYARVPDGDRRDVFVIDEETCARLMRDLNAFGRPPSRSTVEPAAR